MRANLGLHTKGELNHLFEKYYEALVFFANRFLPLRDECEDIVQDVFVGLLENKKTFPDEISTKAFLYKAVRNKCYNVIKHNGVKDKYAAHVVHSLEDDNYFLKQVLEEEIVRQLHKAIETLPEQKKAIIRLSLKGLKNNEIAEELGIKLQTVKTLKSQSYKILRAEFKELGVVISFLIA
ncbi:RNA polymerase sigma-70 factor [Arenibacter sp. ARW7G5Y1]|uniref:RNA polymerase sigma-70 factor n=1 Tax=Arenibacter sp. ARW7G5Y1 TaxID=2135619 RepID=UPI000D76C1EE|nr:RNA polymerase sigma-70 factor [Arenibacter sp. ARW7G5Y1]PXX21454.1 RNA polymerase sigma-70 factor (ECF subfamily) [Arenibacter sp. ARW7G5Y1]